MANQKNIRKELGDEDRELTPDFSRSTQTGAGRADIWMTPELKDAAQALQKAWEISHDDQMGSLNIRDVNLKFSSHEQRTAFLKSLEHLARLVNPNFPNTFPLPKAQDFPKVNVVDGFWTNFWYKYFLPDVFDTVMQDTAATELNTIPAQPEIFALAQTYLKTYGPGHVRMDLVNEGFDRSAVDSLTESLREAQSRLMKFLHRLDQCMSDPEVHRVIILDGQFVVDGVKREFTGAALRAVLVLALLREKADFKLEDFARFFHGGNVIDSRTDFDNAMKALKKELPKTTAHTPSQNHRSIFGIKFLVCVSDDAIVKRLTGLHKK